MSVIDEYLAAVAPPDREALERVAAVIARAAPQAVPGASYGVPTFMQDGRPLVGFTAWKHHLSVHPFSSAVVDAVRDELPGFAMSKGTIRFSAEQPIPEPVLCKIVAHRQAELQRRRSR